MPTPLDLKVRQQIEDWKRQLLDLTRRNRLLNFRPTPRSTIAILDELPSEVFRSLWLDEVAMRFQPVEKASSPEGVAEGSDGDSFTVYEAKDLADRHRDDRLQTRLDRSQLERSLRYIQQQAKSAMDEQGVGTLFITLGMLHFRPIEQSEQLQRAPVLLLEVELEQAGRNSLPKLKVTDEGPIVNPTLSEYLRRNFDVQLPDQDEIEDPIQFFESVRSAIAKFPDWDLRNEIYLGLFSFQKLVMFKDLERNLDTFLSNSLVQRLCNPGDGVPPGIPTDIAGLDLDQAYPPESARVVMDTDASQLRALAAVDRGHDLVIEGPPGTGKSQTIANLIAQTIGSGKTVLFVSEKMAALEVVFSRLRKAGLGDFCFELHSHKARRNAAIADLERSWQATLEAAPFSAESATRLAAARLVLSEYAHQLHAPFGALGWSPYRAIGELEFVREAPAWRWTDSASEIDEARLQDATAALDAWSATAVPMGDPREHPWRYTQRDYYSGDALEDLEKLVKESLEAISDWSRAASDVERTIPLGALRTANDVATADAFGKLLAGSPGVERGVLEQDAWLESAPGLPEKLIEAAQDAARLRAEATQRFRPDALDATLDADIATVRQRHASWHRMLHADYRGTRSRWITWWQPGYRATLGEQADHLEQVVALQKRGVFLADNEEAARALFGDRWRGEDSEAETLSALVSWLRTFRAFCRAHAIPQDAQLLALPPAPETKSIALLVERTAACVALATELIRTTQWGPPESIEEEDRFRIDAGAQCSLTPLRLGESLAGLQKSFGRAVEWCAFLRGRARALELAGGKIIESAMTGAVPFSTLARSYRRGFLRRWLEEAVAERVQLKEFDSDLHERGIDEFRKLDRRIHDVNRQAISGDLRQRAQTALSHPDLSSQVGLLRREIGRKTRHQAIRKTIAQAFDAIRAIKPCFLMSPLTVAQCLDPGQHQFDLVIFDEASQLTPEDAIGAIVRGRQLVVTGDQKQLPPTNFFTIQTEQANGESDSDGMPLYDDSESILELCQRSSFPSSTLRWHYRSRHESLITFSNQSFYDGSLLTFPSADMDCSVRGLRFEFVENGRYEGSGENPREAERVVEAVCEHAVMFARNPERCPTLGVGTFNVRQQSLILDLLADRRKSVAALDEYLSRDKEHGFFVKNLENIQGDDRDYIFLSVTYGRNEQGRVRLNFGPINGENGWRRLNVLVTRARSVMRVFASMRADDIDTASETLGVKLLRKYLRYAETGLLEDRLDDADAGVESPFEGQVRLALEARGYDVVSQVGAAGYRIDLAVKDTASPGRYVCGIECDGASYHSSETARDRDRLRQQILEDLGWSMFRIWSTDWFKDRTRQLDRICSLIEKARIADSGKPAPEKPSIDEPHPPPRQAPTQDELIVPILPSSLPGSVPYQQASLPAPTTSQDFYKVRLSVVTGQAVEVVRLEGPIHEWDVISRVADAWGLQRAGNQIQARVREAIGDACRTGRLKRTGDFLILPNGTVTVRSRAGSGIPMERVAPAEVQAAIRDVLGASGGAARADAIAMVRSLFGFQRTGAIIEDWVSDSIQALIQAKEVGEGPRGLALLR
jgi:very-short-patch-repair endonuclease/DNA polymerase III delta prime subunit